MANHLYFPALKEYNTLGLNDQFTFFPIVADRNDYYGSIDGLARKTTLQNIISFIEDNITVVAESTISVSEEGTSIGSAFTSLNFIGATVTAVNAGSGVANITVTSQSITDTHMMNADLTADANRSHDIANFNWVLEDDGDNVIKYTAPGLLQLGTDTNNFTSNSSGNESSVRVNNATSMYFVASRTITYQPFYLDSVGLVFQNPESNLITISPRDAGVTNTSYKLPISGSEGYLKNNGSNEWSWDTPTYALMSDLTDVSTSYYATLLDWFTQTFTTWAGNEPTEATPATWLTNFDTSTYIMTYDPINDTWIPMPAFDIVSLLQTDVNIYAGNGILAGDRIVDTNGNDLEIFDVDNQVGSASMLRLNNHRFRASGNDIQIGYYSAAAGTAQDSGLRFFTQATTNGGVEDASLIKETGVSGAFVMKNLGVGELWLHNAAAGSANKIILRNDGEVEFSEYGSGTYTNTPSRLATFDTGGIVGDTVSALTSIHVACSDETTDLAAATGVVTFRMRAMRLSEIRASVKTAPVGSVLTVDVNVNGSTILSTKLTIDATEKTSTTAATATIISGPTIPDDAEITIDIDGVGSSTAGVGLKLELIGYYTA